MASVKQKQRKDGSVFYEISVSRGHGLSPYTMRWDRPEGLAGKTVKARLQAVASEFERDCRDGKVKTRKERKAEQEEAEQKKILEARNKMTFKRFCEETFLPDLRLRCSEHTIYNYQLQLEKHIYPDIGALELQAIKAGDINQLLRNQQAMNVSLSIPVKVYANFDMLFITVAALKINEKKFFQHLDVVDTLTVFKDRAPYPHKLSDAIAHYHLERYVENNHTALGDTFALLYVVGAMASEKGDLLQYVNLFGYNPKYPPRYKLPNIDYCEQPYNSQLPLYQKIHRPVTCQTQVKPVFTGNVPLTDNVIMQEVAAPQTFYRGIEYAQLKKVRNLHFLKNEGMFLANVIGSRVYDTEFRVTTKGVITWYRCSCQAFWKCQEMCSRETPKI